MDALELNLHSESDPEVDKRVDATLLALSGTDEDLIIDSRLAWHFLPKSLKIYLTVEPLVGSKRVMRDGLRINEPEYASHSDAEVGLRARKLSEIKRFRQTYGVDSSDWGNYDVIVDATLVTPGQVADLIEAVVISWRNGQRIAAHWVEPQMLLPTEHVRQLAGEAARSVRERMVEGEVSSQQSVEVVHCEGFFFIWDGHKRVSAALLEGVPFIPIEVIAVDGGVVPTGDSVDEWVSSAINLSWYYDWEDVHSFRFLRYPEDPVCEG